MSRAGKDALDEMRVEVRALARRYMERARAFYADGDEMAGRSLKVASQELHAVADEVHEAGMTRRYRPEPVRREEEQQELGL